MVVEAPTIANGYRLNLLDCNVSKFRNPEASKTPDVYGIHCKKHEIFNSTVANPRKKVKKDARLRSWFRVCRWRNSKTSLGFRGWSFELERLGTANCLRGGGTLCQMQGISQGVFAAKGKGNEQ